MKAAEVSNTLGLNTHVNTAPYNETGRIATALQHIGFQNIRQSSPIDAASFSGTLAFRKLGYKIGMIINGGGPVDLNTAM